MTSKFATFAALHVAGDPVVLYNVWDVGSALAVVAAGAKALATGSHPVGDAAGFGDGLVELNLRGGTWIRKIHGFPHFSPLILEVWWFHSFEELNQNSKALFRISQRILGFLDMLLIAQKRIIIL